MINTTAARGKLAETRNFINHIFLPPDRSPWAKFPRDLLEDQDLHPSTALFYCAEAKTLVALIWRKEPTEPRYVGNFPCDKYLLEWLSLRERGGDVDGAFIATIESLQDNEVISIAWASEVADRFLGRIEPFFSSRSSSPFFWLDADMFPVRIRGSRRRFRLLDEAPDFLKRDSE